MSLRNSSDQCDDLYATLEFLNPPTAPNNKYSDNSSYNIGDVVPILFNLGQEVDNEPIAVDLSVEADSGIALNFTTTTEIDIFSTFYASLTNH